MRGAPIHNRRLWGVVWGVVLAGVWAGGMGCSSSVHDEAGESDANGYVCLECQAKFYTKRELFAEHCPACQTTDIKIVNGFVCEKDQQTTIAASGRDSVACDQCGERTTALRLPREKELQAWGAEEKTGQDVLK